MNIYTLNSIIFDTYWREPSNRKYLDCYRVPLPDAPSEVIKSYERYQRQINHIKAEIRNTVYKK